MTTITMLRRAQKLMRCGHYYLVLLVVCMALICLAQFTWIPSSSSSSSPSSSNGQAVNHGNIPLSLLSFAAGAKRTGRQARVVIDNSGKDVVYHSTTSRQEERCAINFYGLPRAFGSLVLPSIVKNIIQINNNYNCDYFVHYYNITSERAGRSGNGGHIQADEVLWLQAAVEKEYNKHQLQQPQEQPSSATLHKPVVLFVSDTNETFFQAHDELIQHVLHAKDDETGTRPLYHPWLEKDYIFPDTTLNIFKMWHSIDRAWHLMDAYGRKHNVKYTRVAMLRSDVVFLTPLDIWDSGVGSNIAIGVNNNHVVIPSFARYPVNDRAVYGNATGVRIWATQRFPGLARHVEDYRGSGYVLHHEHFVDSVLLADMRRLGIQVIEHPLLCFCRARADMRVWFNDCTSGSTAASLKKMYQNTSFLLQSVQDAVGKTCGNVQKEAVSGATSVLCAAG